MLPPDALLLSEKPVQYVGRESEDESTEGSDDDEELFTRSQTMYRDTLKSKTQRQQAYLKESSGACVSAE